MNLSILSGPIIGAIIGYGTNWLAIKMLFRPVNPVKIGKFTLPFTPGIIPKRKESLAKAIGEMVGNHLFTREDMQKMLLSEEIENTIISRVMTAFESETNIKDVICNLVSEEEYAQGRESLKLMLSEKIRDGLLKVGISELIVTEGKSAIKSKVTGMLKMFVTDGLIDSIVQPMGVEIEKYIKEHSQEKIIPIVENEMKDLESKSVKEWMEELDFSVEKMQMTIKDIYEEFVLNYVSTIVEKMDIAKVVESKINEMEILELEKLILSVMKKELSAIVNLGALIGVILGSLNVII